MRIVYCEMKVLDDNMNTMKSHEENTQNGDDAEKTALNYVYVMELHPMRDFRILDLLKILTVLPREQHNMLGTDQDCSAPSSTPHLKITFLPCLRKTEEKLHSFMKIRVGFGFFLPVGLKRALVKKSVLEWPLNAWERQNFSPPIYLLLISPVTSLTLDRSIKMNSCIRHLDDLQIF